MDLLSFDLILDNHGKYWLCEVNGCPFGLRNTFSVPDTGFEKSDRNLDSPLQILANALANSAKSSLGAVALPLDRYSKHSSEAAIGFDDIEQSLVASEAEVLEERMELARLIRHAGVEAILCGSESVEEVKNELRAGDNVKVGALYSNYVFPSFELKDPGIAVCSRALTRRNCRDKLYTNFILKRSGLENLVIPSCSVFNTTEVEKIIGIAKSQSGWLVLKPRNGFGGFGLVRVPCDSILMPGDLIGISEGIEKSYSRLGEIIVQPWIEPVVEVENDNNYYCALHLYSLDGKVIAGHVSAASAPTSVAQKSNLAWLSSLGKKRSIEQWDISSELWDALQRNISTASCALASEWHINSPSNV